MGKGILHLSIDSSIVELAKAEKINISSFVENLLFNELKIKELSDTTTKDELIDKLKAKIALLTSELTIKNKEIESLNQQKKEDSDRITKLKNRNENGTRETRRILL